MAVVNNNDWVLICDCWRLAWKANQGACVIGAGRQNNGRGLRKQAPQPSHQVDFPCTRRINNSSVTTTISTNSITVANTTSTITANVYMPRSKEDEVTIGKGRAGLGESSGGKILLAKVRRLPLEEGYREFTKGGLVKGGLAIYVLLCLYCQTPPLLNPPL